MLAAFLFNAVESGEATACDVIEIPLFIVIKSSGSDASNNGKLGLIAVARIRSEVSALKRMLALNSEKDRAWSILIVHYWDGCSKQPPP